MKERIKYFDVAKGLLILMVVFEHVSIFQNLFHSRSNPVFHFGESISTWLFNLLLMPAFFFIYGCYGMKRQSFGELVRKNSLRLLLPVLLLCGATESSAAGWFCWAIFFAIIFRNLLYRVKSKLLIAAIVCVMPIVGSLMIVNGRNPHFLSHALLLIPFMFFGIYLKPYLNKKFVIFSAFVVYVASVVVFYKLYPIAVSAFTPAITFMTYPTLKQLPLCYVGGISGTICMLTLARFIGSNKYLEFIGRNSLVFYLFHFNILFVEFVLMSDLVHSLQTPGSYVFSVCVYLLEFVGAVVGCAWVAKLINKYCPWVVGKNLSYSNGKQSEYVQE